MRAMVLVKASKASEAGQMPSQELLSAMTAFNEDLSKAGVLLAGEGLHPSSKGARVHFSGKDRIVTDGPFAETEALIAGYWLWQVASLQEAIDWVRRCPNPHDEDSVIEIRPVFEAEEFGEALTPELRAREERLRADHASGAMTDARDEIIGLCARLSRAHADKDADAILACYSKNAVIYDLAPPLGRHGVDRERLAAWLATWEGPIRIDAEDVQLAVTGDRAYSSALDRMRGTKTDGTAVDLWLRTTMVFARLDGGWRIVHHHSSVPFHMDGSFRAAIDLAPQAPEDTRAA